MSAAQAPPKASGSVPSTAAPSAEHSFASQASQASSVAVLGWFNVTFLHVLALADPPKPDSELEEGEPEVDVDEPLQAVMLRRPTTRTLERTEDVDMVPRLHASNTPAGRTPRTAGIVENTGGGVAATSR